MVISTSQRDRILKLFDLEMGTFEISQVENIELEEVNSLIRKERPEEIDTGEYQHDIRDTNNRIDKDVERDNRYKQKDRGGDGITDNSINEKGRGQPKHNSKVDSTNDAGQGTEINFTGGQEFMPEKEYEYQCEKCGHQFNGQVKFCPNCGIELNFE